MDILGVAKQMANGIVKSVSYAKKTRRVEPKSFIKETSEEYAERLTARRNKRH